MIKQIILLCYVASVFADTEKYGGCNDYGCAVGVNQYGPGGASSTFFSSGGIGGQQVLGGLEHQLLGGSLGGLGPIAAGPGGAAASSAAASSGRFGGSAASSAAASGAPGLNFAGPVGFGNNGFNGFNSFDDGNFGLNNFGLNSAGPGADMCICHIHVSQQFMSA
eukprot:XP_011422548.1 PREDICTED: uncharacterized protein LOC105324963 [Crassostrea gigas]